MDTKAATKRPEEALEGEEPGSMFDQSPELIEWFKKYPTEEVAQKLTFEEKKSFILLYYTEEPNSDEFLEKMIGEAENILDKELEDLKKTKQYTEACIYSLLTIARCKIMDDLVNAVDKHYQQRRNLIKGRSMKDPAVIKVTQINCAKLGQALNDMILKQTEEEVKGRGLEVQEIMSVCSYVAMQDVETVGEIERIFSYRKGSKDKNVAISKEKVKEYIKESINISESILKGEIDAGLVFAFPHLLSDRLFNLTGYESEEVVTYMRRLVQEGAIDEELANLVITEAYSVEKSKENCQQSFRHQMMEQERMIAELYARRIEDYKNKQQDMLSDPAVKKMMELGMIAPQGGHEAAKKTKR